MNCHFPNASVTPDLPASLQINSHFQIVGLMPDVSVNMSRSYAVAWQCNGITGWIPPSAELQTTTLNLTGMRRKEIVVKEPKRDELNRMIFQYCH